MKTGNAAATVGAGRFSEVDHLKAVGILAVILIHCIRAPWNPSISPFESWLGLITRFAVPGFLLCSGFLYATAVPIAGKTVLRRLRRVLIPYLVASVGAQLWWFGHGQGRDFSTLVSEVLLGASFGPYYYVFVHFWLVLFAPLFVVVPRRVLWLLTAAMVLSQGFFETVSTGWVSIFWHIRSPLLWWGYFLIGWMLRLYYEPIQRFLTSHRRGMMAGAVAAVALLTVLMSGSPGTTLGRASQWLETYAIASLFFVWNCGRGEPTRPMRIVADATYAIYLFHLFFIYTAQGFIQPANNQFDLLVVGSYWSAGLLGALGVIALARAALGPRSRDFIGA